jgi:hypothetical protein
MITEWWKMINDNNDGEDDAVHAENYTSMVSCEVGNI